MDDANGNGKKQAQGKSISGRVLEIVTQIYTEEAWVRRQSNPEYRFRADDYRIRQNRITNVLEAKRSIKEYAWILHDKDVYTDTDDEVVSGKRVVGDLKQPHVHIVVSGGSKALDVGYVAKWFGVPANMIEIKNGKGAFIDAVRYLTHEEEKQQMLGKHVYADDEVHANFDFRKRINEYLERRKAFGDDEKRLYISMRSAVYKDGMTIDALRRWADKDEHVREIYTQYSPIFKRLRGEYLIKQRPPEQLINIYIEGLGGYGKGALSIMLARCFWRMLNPDRSDYDEVRDREMYFSVGDSRSGLQGYDGQQIVIWEDVRPGALMSLFGGRGATFAALDPHPKDLDYNIKYATTKLLNCVNIMNSVVPFREFALQLTKPKDQLETVEEDYRQVTRRFGLWIIVREADYELMVNEGIYGLGTPRGFEDFKTVKRLDNNIIALIKSDNREAQHKNMTLLVNSIPKETTVPAIDEAQLLPKEFCPITAEQAVDSWMHKNSAKLIDESMKMEFCKQVQGFLKDDMNMSQAMAIVETQFNAHTYISMKVRAYLKQEKVV